jgi:hypothetical protein
MFANGQMPEGINAEMFANAANAASQPNKETDLDEVD